MDFENAAENFLNYCKQARNLSENTLKAYEQDIAELRRYLRERDLAGLGSSEDINAYIEWLSSIRKLSVSTIRRRLACLRAMFKWRERSDNGFSSPFRTADVRLTLPKRLPRCLSAVELRALFQAVKVARPLLRLIITLLFMTGMRVSEITNLRLGDVDIDRRTICIKGKGNRERMVFLVTQEVAQELKSIWIEISRVFPFRVWQFCDTMVEAVRNNDMTGFVCAAGIGAHYVGDACQTLHGSYLNNGYPDGRGAGVHSAYEDAMIDNESETLFDLIGKDLKKSRGKADLLADGQAVAISIHQLMDRTTRALPPVEIVDAYIAAGSGKSRRVTSQLWKQFGPETAAAMADGARILALVWDSAWAAGGGDGLKTKAGCRRQGGPEAALREERFRAISRSGRYWSSPPIKCQLFPRLVLELQGPSVEQAIGEFPVSQSSCRAPELVRDVRTGAPG